MSDVIVALERSRAAVDEFLATTDRCADVWTIPTAPGKWSPSQIVEHIAIALEESATQISGGPSQLPRFPGFLRPVARTLFFNKVLRNSAFPKAKAAKVLHPAAGPATPADARVRLRSALEKFDRACRSRVATARNFQHSVFGTVSVADYARFQELHVRHHRKQLPGVGG